MSENFPCAELLDVVQHWLMNDPTLSFCTATQVWICVNHP